jgi:hypothetical protein
MKPVRIEFGIESHLLHRQLLIVLGAVITSAQANHSVI